MAQPKIDYSGVVQPSGFPATGWKPPRHVYFGPKDPNTGQMAEEPEYTHQEYPKTLYKLDGDVIRALIVANAGEQSHLGAGWEQTPAAFGVLTAPSHDQLMAMQKIEHDERIAAEAAEPVKRGSGRPRKDE